MSITVNTNMSSLICQRSLNKATFGMNTALERMSTGIRINSAKDDAAGCAISSKMDTKISSYAQAMQNAQDGMSLLQTSEGTLSVINSNLERMRDLAEQSANGTYGSDERKAMQAECDSLAEEMTRIKDSTEFNGINLFERKDGIVVLSPEYIAEKANSISVDEIGPKEIQKKSISELEKEYGSGFEVIDTTRATKIANGSEMVVNNKKYVLTVDNSDALQKILDINKNGITALTSDVNVIKEWKAIGTDANAFYGTFDGNGYIIDGLSNSNKGSSYQGVFGHTMGSSELKNITLTNINIQGTHSAAGLVGIADNTKIDNCSVSGTINSVGNSGGLVGQAINNTKITNSAFTNGSIVCSSGSVGGFVGINDSSVIENCYAKGTLNGNTFNGGFVGLNKKNGEIRSSYSNVNVTGGHYTGGFAGNNNGLIEKSFSTSTVIGTLNNNNIGGFIGQNEGSGQAESCYFNGSVTGKGLRTGGFIGEATTSSIINVSNCYSMGEVEGVNEVGGFVGTAHNNFLNVYTTSKVTGKSSVGAFAGNRDDAKTITNSFYNTDINVGMNGTGVGKSVGISGINTQKMQTTQTFLDAGWDKSKWYLKDGSSPILSWQYIPPQPPEPDAILKTIKLQVGIDTNQNSNINIQTGLDIKSFNVDISSESSAVKALNQIDKMLSKVTSAKTTVGRNLNRLDSVIEFQNNQINILSGSSSLIKDADIAKESASYIKNQILQQTTSALLATANQNPSIALSLV